MTFDYRWYWNRWRAMTPDEWVVRARETFQQLCWARGWTAAYQPPAPQLANRPDPWSLPPLAAIDSDAEQRRLRELAEPWLKGHYEWLHVAVEEEMPDWHHDPQTGCRAPLRYAFDIDCRDPDIVGNIKNIWEKSRHQHLTLLAATYACTGDERYARLVVAQLKDWVQHNSFLQGVNWASPLELGIRLIAWVWIERLLRPCADGHHQLFGPTGALWPAIYQQQWLIRQHASYGSSANNHLIGEAAGVFIAASTWPVFSVSRAWQAWARHVLEREIVRQTFPDGLNKEQAFAYHQFVQDFFFWSAAEAQRHGTPFSAAYQQRLQAMRDAEAVLTAHGPPPRYGDDDEGRVLALSPTGRPDDLACTLAATTPLAPSRAATRQMAGDLEQVVFPAAGLYGMVRHGGTPQEEVGWFDAGPLGYGRIAAYGHADALAFTWQVAGRPILVDPGTGSYYADPDARAYFRSTAAHNTVLVDGLDQSEPGGVFLWMRPATCRVIASGPDFIEAEHDGYRRLDRPVIHRRRLEWTDEGWTCRDLLTGRGRHEIELRFHFHPDCRVRVDGGRASIQWTDGQRWLELDTQLEWRVVSGTLEGGWYSSHFNRRTAAPMLIGSRCVALPVTFQSRCT